jgi:tRNA pseudouridine55 synthase
MNGILLINKPKDYTSHDVVNVLRKLLHTKKIGHTGTLDPDATGLLVLGINQGTKIMQYLNNDDKEYIAEICIGRTTDTLDNTGEIIEEKVVQSLENVDQVLASFVGRYTQTPPMYSAIKYQGKRLYEYARKGIVIDEIPSREIDIQSIERVSEIVYQDDKAYFLYRVHASKGLYVRTLSYDIGRKLGYPSYNHQLHRTKAGNFDVKDSYTLEEVKQNKHKLITLSDALVDLQEVALQDDFAHHVQHGMAISLRYFNEPRLSKIVDHNKQLLAIYDKHPTEAKMKAINIFPKD